MGSEFTRADASGLWHAVQAFDLQVREMKKMDPGFAPSVIEAEELHLAAAKRALRKVQAIRRSNRTAAATGENRHE